MSDDIENDDGRDDGPRITPLGGGLGAASARARRPSGLGRGLSALLGEIQTEAPVSGQGNATREGLAMLSVADLHPHPDQPRRHFDEQTLNELADSIRQCGMVQPILARPAPTGRGWQIVAGERRWRAAQRAGLHQVPVIVRDLDDGDTFTIALIENIQRKDLTAIEEADAYAGLRDRMGHTVDAIGKMTGKSRSHVANILRLLELPEAVRALVADGQLGMGHARALIGHPDAVALARKAVQAGYSVRKVEALVRVGRVAASGSKSAKGARQIGDSGGDADIAALESHLENMLGLKVRITHSAAMSGSVTLDYGDLEQLDMLCQRLSGDKI